MLSAIAAPSAGTLQNLCTYLVRVPVLGAVMVESAVSTLQEDCGAGGEYAKELWRP